VSSCVPKNKEQFLEKYSKEISRLKEDFFFAYTETGSIQDALARMDITYWVFRGAKEFDDDFFQVVRAADSYLDDRDEALLRNVAHGKAGFRDFDRVQLTAVTVLLNNRRYNRPDAAVVAPPEIRRYLIPRPKPKVEVGEDE